MKKFLLFFVIILITATVLTLCKRKGDGSKKMNGEQLKKEFAIVFPDLEYEGDEPPTMAPGAKSAPKKAKASAITFSVYPNSLPITTTDSTMSSTAPINTQWFGGQKFVDTTTNDGAKGLWACGRLFDAPNNMATDVTCPTEGPGYYRFFASDFQYNVRLSKFETKL